MRIECWLRHLKEKPSELWTYNPSETDGGNKSLTNKLQIMKKFIVVQEDEGLFNMFERDMFDKDGYIEGYEGIEGYNIKDMDIVAEFNTMEKAEDYIDKHSY